MYIHVMLNKQEYDLGCWFGGVLLKKNLKSITLMICSSSMDNDICHILHEIFFFTCISLKMVTYKCTKRKKLHCKVKSYLSIF